MAEPKPLASLSGSLLARKGAAKPAMRRQGMTGMSHHAGAVHQDDLGWNDMGYDVNPAQNEDQVEHQRIDLTPMLTPVQAVRDEDQAEAQDAALSAPVPEVVRQRAVLAEKIKRTDVPAIIDGIMPEASVASAAPVAPASAVVAAPAAAASHVAPSVRPVAGTPSIKLPRAPRRQAGSGSKAAFTLRIDSERHLRLRLASAVTRRSAQIILIDALDKYLKSLPEIDALAHQLPQK